MNKRATAVAVTVGTAAAVHLAPAAVAWRRARCLILPRLSGVGRPDHVALTFDDGPDPASTPAILDALATFGWRATFFCLGSQARRHPDLVSELVGRGHEIGVHGDTHRSHLRRVGPEVVRDVRAAKVVLEDLGGHSLRWFRPPYGAVSAASLLAARRNDLDLVLWTTWGQDWRADASAASVARNVHRTYMPGATVLLHDSDVTSAAGSWKATVDALPLLAGEWHRMGLEVGPLSEHFPAR